MGEERESKQKRRGAGCFRQWKYMHGNIATIGIWENCFESIAAIYLCLVCLLSKTQRTVSALLLQVYDFCCVLSFFLLVCLHHISSIIFDYLHHHSRWTVYTNRNSGTVSTNRDSCQQYKPFPPIGTVSTNRNSFQHLEPIPPTGLEQFLPIETVEHFPPKYHLAKSEFHCWCTFAHKAAESNWIIIPDITHTHLHTHTQTH